MSGRKCSQYHLDVERERRSQLLEQISALQRQVQGLGQQITDMLRCASEGVRRHFAQQAKEAHKWWERAQSASSTQQWSMSSTSSRLSAGLSQLQTLVEEGKSVQRRLTEAFVHRANRLRRDLNSRLAHLDGVLSSRRALIRQWLGAAQEQQLAGALKQARQSVQADDFEAAESQLKALHGDLEAAVKLASQKEAEHIRQEHVRELADLRREVEACAHSLEQLLESASAGLQATFAAETERARQWLQHAQAVRKKTARVRDNAKTSQLREAIDRLRSVLRDGHAATELLQQAFTERASELRTQAEAQLSAVEVLFNGGRELLSNWFGEQEVHRLQAGLQRLRDTLQAERLRDVTAPCQTLQEELQGKLHYAQEQEAKHQRRVYLLKALRQVCAEMGFGEVAPPRYERTDDRSSRIVLTVDTFNQGLVTFYLSLESIEADSGITETHCFEEFDKLSAQLAEQFGVQTKFRLAEGEPRPQLKRKGELEEPSGAQRTLAK